MHFVLLMHPTNPKSQILPLPPAPSRVEKWRGGLGGSLGSPVARPFVCECLSIATMLRFHSPLIEPDRRISRIRLSDKEARLGTQAARIRATLRGRAQRCPQLLNVSGC